MDNTDQRGVRIQDIVAKTARVNLRDTVRVLRALALVLNSLNEKGAVSRLNHLLYRSAQFGDYASPLHSKPDANAIRACDDFYQDLVDEYGPDILKALFELTSDPYFDTRLQPPHVEGV